MGTSRADSHKVSLHFSLLQVWLTSTTNNAFSLFVLRFFVFQPEKFDPSFRVTLSLRKVFNFIGLAFDWECRVPPFIQRCVSWDYCGNTGHSSENLVSWRWAYCGCDGEWEALWLGMGPLWQPWSWWSWWPIGSWRGCCCSSMFPSLPHYFDLFYVILVAHSSVVLLFGFLINIP